MLAAASGWNLSTTYSSINAHLSIGDILSAFYPSEIGGVGAHPGPIGVAAPQIAHIPLASRCDGYLVPGAS